MVSSKVLDTFNLDGGGQDVVVQSNMEIMVNQEVLVNQEIENSLTTP